MDIKYLAYNLLKTDYSKLNKYINKLNNRGVRRISIIKDMIYCLFKYDTFLLDYFHFKYFNKDVPRDFYTNVWDMYRFQKRYNSRNYYMDFRNKCLFREKFKEFFLYDYYVLSNQNDIPSLIDWIKKDNKDKVVVKDPMGAVGKGVKVLKIKSIQNELYIEDKKANLYIEDLFNNGFVLFESFIEQHPILKELNPSSVNTIRIITFLNDYNIVEIWGALIRIGFNKEIDNFDAGGLGANIDLKTGIVDTKAIIKDPFTEKEYESHPITGAKIKGIQIPYWDEIIKLVEDAGKNIPEVRTVGWDIAVTTQGPTLIEGNDNWNRVLFQLATGIGLNSRIKSLL